MDVDDLTVVPRAHLGGGRGHLSIFLKVTGFDMERVDCAVFKNKFLLSGCGTEALYILKYKK